ncbi:tRNA uridine-5-carboxymethylaminomethyl(34) synthesis GTPase MnmE [Methylobacterium sp. J-090]|uniref:tRNA uridine-5-carboxymethylaminomethyl(34) synthesis GTPase MnmE n=1 Tax=Methylobacterium sp. J-090 TaxID=2836666 RepID=UPI001FBA206B|nr:tRNA uridine-5-carboxymethylaminomethyl(34) synthesis GTPase MnmE [Methylobacterium sp. J-090]MCJ2084368.1 tRNA uridine-5-carboxymethylaminomethyl(34) synthesis GTPase MnmE [Methylobacterium sp. J-090]
MDAPSTIFAPASGFGRAAVAVLRISGPESERLLTRLAGPLPAPRRLVLRPLRDPQTGETLDQALVVWMPGPGTFTGEDMAELHLHGGPAVRTAVLRALATVPGCVPAAPGDFTRRAFLNGRMGLTEAEGIADLIDAETEAQRRQALRQLDGALGHRVAAWRDGLIDLLAGVEAALDFSDEGDVDDAALDAALFARARGVRDDIAATLADGRRGERLRDGFTVVLAGPPNAGKSTLLNALSRRDAAIVSAIPGTTRDVIEVRCDLGGLPVLLVDTAGLREATDAIEAEGIRRTRARMAQADLVLLLDDARIVSDPVPLPDTSRDPRGSPLLEGEEQGEVCELSGEVPHLTPTPSFQERKPVVPRTDMPGLSTSAPEQGLEYGSLLGSGVAVLRVSTKADLLPVSVRSDTIAISAVTGYGLDTLLDAIEHHAENAVGGEAALITRERHRDGLTRCRDHLDRLLQGTALPELAAEDLRLAVRALGEVAGHVSVEEMLDRLFSGFCIGK